MGLWFKTFEEDDIAKLTNVMKRAYDEDARLHLGLKEGGFPGYDNGDFMRKWHLRSGINSYTLLKDTNFYDDIAVSSELVHIDSCAVLKDGNPIGAAAMCINENNENYLWNLFIDPDYQNKGLGLIVWKYIERKYPKTVKWRTSTPGYSLRNHAFYVNKCGFNIVKITDYHDLSRACYHFEKVM